jgi:hypothetical protein
LICPQLQRRSLLSLWAFGQGRTGHMNAATETHPLLS